MWGGGGAGGYSSGIGGQRGMMRGNRGVDGWDEEYLGKPYDAEVVRKMIPHLKHRRRALIFAFACMLMVSVSIYVPAFFHRRGHGRRARGRRRPHPHLGGHARRIGPARVDCGDVPASSSWPASAPQMLYELRSEMYEHMQGLSLSFYDEMEVGRMISRLTSDVDRHAGAPEHRLTHVRRRHRRYRHRGHPADELRTGSWPSTRWPWCRRSSSC